MDPFSALMASSAGFVAAGLVMAVVVEGVGRVAAFSAGVSGVGRVASIVGRASSSKMGRGRPWNSSRSLLNAGTTGRPGLPVVGMFQIGPAAGSGGAKWYWSMFSIVRSMFVSMPSSTLARLAGLSEGEACKPDIVAKSFPSIVFRRFSDAGVGEGAACLMSRRWEQKVGLVAFVVACGAALIADFRSAGGESESSRVRSTSCLSWVVSDFASRPLLLIVEALEAGFWLSKACGLSASALLEDLLVASLETDSACSVACFFGVAGFLGMMITTKGACERRQEMRFVAEAVPFLLARSWRDCKWCHSLKVMDGLGVSSGDQDR